MLLYIKLMKVKKGVAKLSCGSLKFALLWLVLLSLTACVGLPVHGSVVGQTIETRVDSEVARYYLANYLAGKRDNALLDERIDRVYQSAMATCPTRVNSSN